MKSNVIPRKFNRIIGKMLIDTTGSKVNDIVHITKDDCNRLLLVNTRTQERACPFISMLRISEVFELISVE